MLKDISNLWMQTQKTEIIPTKEIIPVKHYKVANSTAEAKRSHYYLHPAMSQP